MPATSLTASLPPTPGGRLQDDDVGLGADRGGGSQAGDPAPDDDDAAPARSGFRGAHRGGLRADVVLLHEAGEPGQLVRVGGGHHTVAEVEDVATGRAPGLDHVRRPREHQLGGREDEGRVEVPLHARGPRPGRSRRPAGRASPRRRRRHRPPPSARAARPWRRRSGSAARPAPRPAPAPSRSTAARASRSPAGRARPPTSRRAGPPMRRPRPGPRGTPRRSTRSCA